MLTGVNNVNCGYKPSFKADLEVKCGSERRSCSALVHTEIPIPIPRIYKDVTSTSIDYEQLTKGLSFVETVKEKFAEETADSSGTLRLWIDANADANRMEKNMDYHYFDENGDSKKFSVKLDSANYYHSGYSSRWNHDGSMTVKDSDESVQMLKKALNAFEYRVPLVEQVEEDCKPINDEIEQKKQQIKAKEQELMVYTEEKTKEIDDLIKQKRKIQKDAYNKAEKEKPFPFFVSENSRRGIFGLPSRYNVF